MTEISVACLIPYAPRVEKRTQVEWDAVHMKRVVKDEQLNSSFSFKINGFNTKIDRNNIRIFQSEVNRRFRVRIAADHPYPVCIVPVPNGDAVVAQNNSFRTLGIAKAIVAQGIPGAVVLDLLRWNEAVGKSHLGERSRKMSDHLNALRINGTTDLPIVVFDDVLTTGSQMAAAKVKLTDAGFNVVGCYTILETLEEGVRAEAPGWRIVTRDVGHTVDMFAGFS